MKCRLLRLKQKLDESSVERPSRVDRVVCSRALQHERRETCVSLLFHHPMVKLVYNTTKQNAILSAFLKGENMFETNQNKPERVLRFLITVLLLPAPFVLEQNVYTIIVAAVGGILLFNAVSGTCMTYKMFGVNTCKIPKP